MLIDYLPKKLQETSYIAMKHVGGYRVGILAEHTFSRGHYDAPSPVAYHVAVSSPDYGGVTKYSASFRCSVVPSPTDLPSGAPLAVYEAIHEAFNFIKTSLKSGITLPAYEWLNDLGINLDEWLEDLRGYSSTEHEVASTIVYGHFGTADVDDFASNNGYNTAYEVACEVAQPLIDKMVLEAQVDTITYAFNAIKVETIYIKGKTIGPDWYSWAVTLKPKFDWRDTLNRLAESISGYGWFEFNGGSELMEYLPTNSPKMAFVNHSHHMAKHYLVYGGECPSDYFNDTVNTAVERLSIPYAEQRNFNKAMLEAGIFLNEDEVDEE